MAIEFILNSEYVSSEIKLISFFFNQLLKKANAGNSDITVYKCIIKVGLLFRKNTLESNYASQTQGKP